MRWPDIFFRARKRRNEPPPAGKTSPEAATKLASTVIPTTAIKPTPAASEASPEAKGEPASSSSNPALRPAVRSTKPVVLSTTPTPTPIATDEDPLKVFARANSIRLAKKADQVVSSSETTPPIAPEPVTSISAPTEPPKEPEPVVEATPSPLPETPSPAPESGVTSATTGRRKAKLTDVARILPTSDSTEPELEPPSAVSPPAFTVEVPVGSVTQPEESPKAPDAPIDKPIETKAPDSAPIEPGPSMPELEKKPDEPTPEKAAEPAPLAPDQSPKPEPPPSMPFEHLPAKAPEKKNSSSSTVNAFSGTSFRKRRTRFTSITARWAS